VLRKIIAGIAIVTGMGVLAGAGTARAGEHEVRDDAGLFRPGFVKLADEVLDDIHARTNKDLMIQTFPTIPEEMRATAQQQDKQGFYDHWVISEARAHNVNGVFILITKDPPHIQVGVGKETREKAFTFKDRDELVAKLAEDFHDHQFDRGLMDAANFVRQRMASNQGIPVPREAPTTQPASAPVANETNK
jgi:uncharacterized membrane protein YgcG